MWARISKLRWWGRRQSPATPVRHYDEQERLILDLLHQLGDARARSDLCIANLGPVISTHPSLPDETVVALANIRARRDQRLGRTAEQVTAEPAPIRDSDLIRARIAGNRLKRLVMAERMKTEAGVSEHYVNGDELEGLALLETGRIESPEGRNISQLHIVAHECGHIFLHCEPYGRRLPTHVKEFEAECYAHQALHRHGMVPTAAQTLWGRRYVQSWIDKDRANGFAIHPAAQAYADGGRSAYLPLRRVPDTWSAVGIETAPLDPPIHIALPATVVRGQDGDYVDRPFPVVVGSAIVALAACVPYWTFLHYVVVPFGSNGSERLLYEVPMYLYLLRQVLRGIETRVLGRPPLF